MLVIQESTLCTPLLTAVVMLCQMVCMKSMMRFQFFMIKMGMPMNGAMNASAMRPYFLMTVTTKFQTASNALTNTLNADTAACHTPMKNPPMSLAMLLMSSRNGLIFTYANTNAAINAPMAMTINMMGLASITMLKAKD